MPFPRRLKEGEERIIGGYSPYSKERGITIVKREEVCWRRVCARQVLFLRFRKGCKESELGRRLPGHQAAEEGRR